MIIAKPHRVNTEKHSLPSEAKNSFLILAKSGKIVSSEILFYAGDF
jgi:hypothetical protein